MEDGKIIQIIPAPENMYVDNEDEWIVTKVAALGLTKDGDTIPLDITEGDALVDGFESGSIVWLTFDEFRSLQKEYRTKHENEYY